MLEPSTCTVCTAYWMTTYSTSARNTISSVSLRKDFWRGGCAGAGGCAMCGCAILYLFNFIRGRLILASHSAHAPGAGSGDLFEERCLTPERTDHGQLQRLAKEVLADPHHVVGGDGIDLRDRLVDVLDAAGQRLLTSIPGGHGVGAFHLQQQATLVELLGLGELRLVDRLVAQAALLACDGDNRTRGLPRLGAGVDAEHTRVVHLVDVRVNVVGEPQLLANLEEQPRAHPLAEHAVENVDHVAVAVHVGGGM